MLPSDLCAPVERIEMRKLPFIRTVRRFLGATANNSADQKTSSPKAKIGMISRAEMDFYCESAAGYFGKEGAIVDLGCWMGATSIALARGILSHGSEAGHSDEKVLGFDTFQWANWMPARIPYGRYLPGETFLPEARRIVSDQVGDRAELIKADLNQYQWTGGAIKILLIDVMKTESLALQVARNFFPSLTPESLLIQQDFKHYFTAWIHLLHYRLREYFRFYKSVPQGTVAFHVTAPIPRDAIDRATAFTTFPDDEIEASFHYSLQLAEPFWEGKNAEGAERSLSMTAARSVS